MKSRILKKVRGLCIGVVIIISSFTAMKIIDNRAYALESGESSQTGLIAEWKFDENTGTIAHDTSGNNNHGTIYGATWASGISGSALNFDGVDDYIEVPDSPSLNPSNQLTISVWLNLRDNTRRNIIEKKPTAGLYSSYFLRMIEDNSGRIEFQLKTTETGLFLYSNSVLPLNKWIYVAVTYDGSMARLYINGVEDCSAPASGEIVPNDLSVQIGGGPRSGGYYFKGIMDEFYLYNRALSAAEIEAYYHQYAFSVLDIVEKAARWVISQAIPEGGGYKWPHYLGWHSGAIGYDSVFMEGNAGIGTFFLDLYKRTGNTSYLDYAKGAARWIITDAVPIGDGYKWACRDAQSDHWWISAQMNGGDGIAEFLIDMYLATGNITYLQYAEGYARWLISKTEIEAGGYYIHYNPDYQAVFGKLTGFLQGQSGRGTFFLDLYKITNNLTYLQYAEGIARWLINTAISDNGAYKWNTGAPYSTTYDAGFHTSAGIAPFFYNLYQTTGNITYLNYAEGAMKYLILSAEVSGNTVKWYYNWPSASPPPPYTIDDYSLLISRLLAPIGSVLLWWYNITGNVTYLNYAVMQANWILTHAVPEGSGYKFYRTEGGNDFGAFWNAHVYRYLMEIYSITKNATYLEYADGALQWIIYNATVEGGNYKWYHKYQNQPEDPLDYKAHWYGGASGIGHLLLKGMEYVPSLIFEENFSNLDNWYLVVYNGAGGSENDPAPQLDLSMGNPPPSLDVNGDGWCGNGAYTKATFDYTNGLVIEFDMYVATGFDWNWGFCGLSDHMPNLSNPRGDGAYIDPTRCDPSFVACVWFMDDGYSNQVPPILQFAIKAEDGTIWGYTYAQDATEYENEWHNYKINIRPDGYVEFYMDGVHIVTSSKRIDKSLSPMPILLGSRDACGPVRVDNVRVLSYAEENRPPNKPALLNPANGATGVSINPTLSWQCSDVDGDALTYDVYFGTSSNPPYRTTTTSTSYNPGTLSYSTTYYWRIVAKDGKGGETSSDIWHFTTIPIQDNIPPSVRIIAPNGGETLIVGNVFRIRWEASDNVGVRYVHIWLFQGSSQISIIADNYPNEGYYDWVIPNRPGGNYKIRIAAVDAAGNAGVDDSDATFLIQSQTPSNSPPIAYIDSISPNPANYGQTVNFVGHGSDSDGTIVEYSWRSSIDGFLSNQASFSKSNLSIGMHTIYFKVKDNNGTWSNEVSQTLKINPSSIDWEKTRQRFVKYKDCQTLFKNYFFNCSWWINLSQEHAQAAANYNFYNATVKDLFNLWTLYLQIETGLPFYFISSHLGLMLSLAESLIRIYNMFLSMYEATIGYTLYGTVYYTYLTDSLDNLIRNTDKVIDALNKKNPENLTASLQQLKGAIENAFDESKNFDQGVYESIELNPTMDLIPLLTRARIYGGIRAHIISFRDVLMLEYLDVTSLQGKIEYLHEKKPGSLLSQRPNLPLVIESYWEVEGKKVTEARRGDTVKACIKLGTKNISKVEYDKVKGSVKIAVKKEGWLLDEKVAEKIFSVDLSPNQMMEISLSFIPNDASGIWVRGYYIEVTFSGEYLFFSTSISDQGVEWCDGAIGSMRKGYPPRLRVKDPLGATKTTGTAIIMQETFHRLYLHVYDRSGNHVGVNYETNLVEKNIPDSEYYEGDRITMIYVPLNLTELKIVVDAKSAEEEIEKYELMVETMENLQIKDCTNITQNITKGETHQYKMEISPEKEITLSKTEKPSSKKGIPGFELIAIVGAILIIFAMRKRKEQ